MPSFFQSRLLTGVLVLLCLWLGLLAVGAGLRHAAADRELAKLNDRIEAEQRDAVRLTAELERMKQPAWLALLARTRLNYKRPDETVVFVYKSEKSGTISPPQTSSDARSNWKKWQDWLRGK